MIICVLTAAIGFASCGGDGQKSGNSGEEKNTGKRWFEYNPAATTVSWTAYKFTEAIGVHGRFDSISITGEALGETAIEVFKNAAFRIPVSSVSTGDAGRDQKIRDFFFGALKNSQYLSGRVDHFEGMPLSGKAVLIFQLNDTAQRLEADYNVSGDTLRMEGIINTDNWHAEAGIASLNKQCADLHKGSDGKTVLWPEVKFMITTVLTRKTQ